MYFPSPDGSATGNLVVSATTTIQGRDAEESSAGESEDTGGVPIIKMLEVDEGNMTNTSDGLAKVTTAASNRVNEGAEMPVVVPTAEHRETVANSTRTVGRATVTERVVTRAGRVNVPLTRLVQEMGMAAMEIELQELCPRKCRFSWH